MSKTGLLLSLFLLLGVVGCDSESVDPAVHPVAIDAVLAEYADQRAEVIAAIGRTRGIELRGSAALDRAAARHALDLATHRTSTHLGRDGLGPIERAREEDPTMGAVREFIFRIEGDRDDLGRSAAATWLAPLEGNAVLTEPCTHAAVAFAPVDEGGCVGVLLLAQR